MPSSTALALNVGLLHYSLQAVHKSAGETVDICMCVDVTLILTRVKRHHDDKCTVATEHTGTTDNRPTVQNGVDASPLTVRCFVTPYFCSKNLLSVRARVTSDNIIIPGLFLAGDVADVLYAESNILCCMHEATAAEIPPH